MKEEFDAAINNTVLKCSSSSKGGAKQSGSKMYISDVQEDDLEIAIKVGGVGGLNNRTRNHSFLRLE